MDGLNNSIKMDNNSLLDYHISNEHFYKAIKRLKCEKQDGILTNLLLNILSMHQSYIMNTYVLYLLPYLKYIYMPNALILFTLLPISKTIMIYKTLANTKVLP